MASSTGVIGSSPELKFVKTEQKEFNHLERLDEAELAEMIPCQETALVYWQSADKVDFGLYKDEKLRFHGYEPNWKHLQEIRVFNRDWELHIWRKGTGYAGRWIRDLEEKTECADVTENNCLDQKVKLWGSKTRQEGGFTIISEERGMSLALPCVDMPDDGINAFLQEKRYLGEDDAGCVYFRDRRFCWIWISENKKELKKMVVSESV